MVSQLALKIIKKAVAIRLERGEALDDIMESYPKLSDDQAAQVRAEFEEKKED